MRLTLFLLIVSSISGYSQNIRPLDSLTVKNAAFIGLVEVTEIENYGADNNMLHTTIVQCFKVSKKLELQKIVFRVKGDPSGFRVGSNYLVFAQDDEGRRYSINKYSRILDQEESEKDIAYLLSVLPCFDSKMKEQGGGCVYRNAWYVCGCDSKTYITPCEAGRDGIVIFRTGKCK